MTPLKPGETPSPTSSDFCPLTEKVARVIEEIRVKHEEFCRKNGLPVSSETTTIVYWQ